MALIRRKSSIAEPEPAPPPPEPGARKDKPTPTRRQAEAARRERITPTLTKKDARRQASKQQRTERMRAVSAREAVPEKALMRDYIDSRFNIGEFLLPSVVVILAVTLLGQIWPAVTLYTTLVMYVFILACVVDCFLMWRGFKRVLAERLPRASQRGLLLYGLTRATQLRRFRMPKPRINRREVY